MTHLLILVIYLSFISLGLPDSLLGAAWPSIYPQFNCPISGAGLLSMIISAGTVLSSLQCDRLSRRFGTGRITAYSVALTAVSLLGFSISRSYWMLCLWCIPYGLGAGCVDASLNNYVALHYPARHMSWLHCMWGVGASIGPMIMATMIAHSTWNDGYRVIGLGQIVLSIIIFISLPLWKNRPAEEKGNNASPQTLSVKQALKIPGVSAAVITFFCYCALETTAGLWASSYLVLHHSVHPETAARFASLFYLGITAGRLINGFVSIKLTDRQMITLGEVILLLGVLLMLLPLGQTCALIGLVIIGLGCAPIYPSMIHQTPICFGSERSQSIIGIQMACAYVGSMLMPSCFGLIQNVTGIGFYPIYLLIALVTMSIMTDRLKRIIPHA